MKLARAVRHLLEFTRPQGNTDTHTYKRRGNIATELEKFPARRIFSASKIYTEISVPRAKFRQDFGKGKSLRFPAGKFSNSKTKLLRTIFIAIIYSSY